MLMDQYRLGDFRLLFCQTIKQVIDSIDSALIAWSHWAIKTFNLSCAGETRAA
jgi:hypothetical protein